MKTFQWRLAINCLYGLYKPADSGLFRLAGGDAAQALGNHSRTVAVFLSRFFSQLEVLSRHQPGASSLCARPNRIRHLDRLVSDLSQIAQKVDPLGPQPGGESGLDAPKSG